MPPPFTLAVSPPAAFDSLPRPRGRGGSEGLHHLQPHAAAGGRDAGHVTSAVYSPRLERNVALAVVLTEREAGAALRVTLEDGSERAAAVAGGDWSVSSGLRIGV